MAGGADGAEGGDRATAAAVVAVVNVESSSIMAITLAAINKRSQPANWQRQPPICFHLTPADTTEG